MRWGNSYVSLHARRSAQSSDLVSFPSKIEDRATQGWRSCFSRLIRRAVSKRTLNHHALSLVTTTCAVLELLLITLSVVIDNKKSFLANINFLTHGAIDSRTYAPLLVAVIRLRLLKSKPAVKAKFHANETMSASALVLRLPKTAAFNFAAV